MKAPKRFAPGSVAALLLMCFAFVAAAIISRDVLERLPRLEDEYAYLFQARIFARGQVWVPRHEPEAYLWQPFVLQPEPGPDGVARRFGKYLPGWPLVLVPGIWFGQPWAINAFLAMLNVGLVYQLGREIFDGAVGLAAALLLAISPMALLLNATLMSHTWAMFATLVFVYAYWRVTRRGRGQYAWAILGGLMIGLLVSTRPLTAVAMTVPIALHAFWGLLTALDTGLRAGQGFRGALRSLRLLAVMAAFALPTSLLWPLYNHLTTGDWRTNTYTLLWEYDRVGFGPGYGLNRGGHSLYWAFRSAQADLNFWFRDLFGFTLDQHVAGYLRDRWGWGVGVGLSWIPLLAGLIAGRKNGWIWCFFGFFASIVISGLFYWIGSVVHGAAAYSVRYYYEATFGVCLVAGYGVVAWARALRGNSQLRAGIPPRFGGRLRLAWAQCWPGYIVLLVACGLSLAGYTPARFREPIREWQNGLYGYNKVGRAQLAAIEAARAIDPDKPVLIIVLRSPVEGDRDNWRDYGTAMSMTSPYLDSDIIVVRVFDPENAPEIRRRFSGRLVLYQMGEHLYPSIEDALAGAGRPGS